MHTSLPFIRVLFVVLSMTFFTAFAYSQAEPQTTTLFLAAGAGSGFLFGLSLIILEYFYRKMNLQNLNLIILGLFIGYLLASGILLSFDSLLSFSKLQIEPNVLALVHAAIYLAASYLAVVMTIKASSDIYASIPFVKLNPDSRKSKDILLDSSALYDARMVDFASTGVLDQRLVIPRFLLVELYEQAESIDENVRAKARKALETYKKLESVDTLELRATDIDFPEIKDSGAKLMRLARQLECSILTADPGRTHHSHIDGIRIISFGLLSNAVKPMAHTGETITIKIQRYGKEPRQGVGYLDDGTMVVVNGGAEFIGATIRAQVLSVKHTTSGRMIFCNAVDSDLIDEPAMAGSGIDGENSASNYFAL